MRVILSAGGWAARAGSLRGGTRESRDEIQQVRNLLHGEAFASRRRFSCCLVRRFPRLPGGLLAPRRDPRAGEAELRRLLEPQIHLAQRADLARKADLAEYDRLFQIGKASCRARVFQYV